MMSNKTVDFTDTINKMFDPAKKKNEDTKYQYSYVPMEEVIKNPDEYIIPELHGACKKLWNNNIFTFMCSNRDDAGHSYILLEELSKENQQIFDNMRKKYPENFIYDEYRECFGIDFATANMSEQDISKIFVQAVKCFKSQDVPKKFYLTREEFLIGCGCYKEVPNPKYKGIDPMPIDSEKFNEWLEKSRKPTPEMLKIFDKSKVTKPFEEYLKEKNVHTFDSKTQRIYSSEYFLNKHIEFMNKSAQQEILH